MLEQKIKIILASGSPRRTMLLSMCGIPHTVRRPLVKEEKGSGLDPGDLVRRNARKKAEAIAKGLRDCVVLGFDTIVYLNGEIIGKLRSKSEVRAMLHRYSGKLFAVYTGISVVDTISGRSLLESVSTKVRMKKVGKERLDAWVNHLGAFDKAGGFSIEGPGALLFSYVGGCFYNVLGLPLAKLDDMFGDLGYDLLTCMKRTGRASR
ncbi:MAG: nucleoside triphosphate pyrophosphatase [Candidatus Omnitrophota bacterium]